MGLVLCSFSGKGKKNQSIFCQGTKAQITWEDTPAAHPRADVPPERLGASPVGQREKTATYSK